MKSGKLQPREQDIVQSVVDYLRYRGAWVFRVTGHLAREGDRVFGQRKGVPDILFILDGRGGGVEVKRPGKQPTAHQQAELDAIARAGGWAIVAHSLEELMAALNIGQAYALASDTTNDFLAERVGR